MKPMLAGKCENIGNLKYPVMASPKLDGVRALIIDGVVMSRSLKPIPNQWVQKTFGNLPNGTDGELIFGDPTMPDAYRKTVSAVMSEDGEPTEVKFHVFDNFTLSVGFRLRYKNTFDELAMLQPKNTDMVLHTMIADAGDLEDYEEAKLKLGYEGVMVRSIDGPYKEGRSTAKEGYLLKVKRFEDAEAEIVGVYEWMHNENEAKKNALGHTERSTHQENLVGMNVLGGLYVKGLEAPYKGVEFSIGTGFQGAADKDGERSKLWKIRNKLSGKIVKFKYFASGSKERPRFPVFLGFRDPIDR